MAGDGTASPLCRIAVDAMGGDHAPDEIVKGAILAVEEYPHLAVVLVGLEEVLREKLGAAARPRIEIVDAREVVDMTDTALAPLRRKRNSSIRVCANLVAEKKVDAMVSAGHTGATWTSAKAVMGMIEGVSRPALAQVMPRYDGVTLLLDVGANVHAKPDQLREFAVMGHYYSREILGIESPRIGLMSIGEEEGKGNELTKETFRILKETGLNFIGNAEGRDIFNGRADVVVCDGFVGNIVLKASESLGEMVWRSLAAEFGRNPFRRMVGAMAYPLLKGLKKRMDWAEYGGAPLLGINGGCIVCHGRSNAKAIKNAIRVADEFVTNRIDTKIHDRIGDLHSREHGSKILAR
jgi:glycerol-3-phosphate acyltransferase PlsX